MAKYVIEDHFTRDFVGNIPTGGPIWNNKEEAEVYISWIEKTYKDVGRYKLYELKMI